MKQRLVFIKASFVLLALSATTTGLRADSFTWTGGGGNGLWTNFMNWDHFQVPKAGDTVFIRNATNVVLLNSTSQISSLVLGGGTNSATLKIQGGALQCSSASVIETNGILQLWENMTNGGALTVKGRVEWNGGTFGAGTTGAVTILSGGELRIAETNAKSLLGGFRNDGLVSCYSTNVGMTPSVAFTNNANFRLYDQLLLSPSGDGLLLNMGTIALSGGLGQKQFLSYCIFTNWGTIKAETNTVFEIVPASYFLSCFADGTRFEGPGLVRVATTDNYVACDGTITIVDTLEWDTLQTGGQAVWNGPGLLRWVGGRLADVTFSPGFEVEVAGAGFPRSLQGACTNFGTVHWRTSNTLTLFGGLDNLGSWVAETNFSMFSGGYGRFNNLGLITTAPGCGTVSMTVGCAFTNRSVVSAATNTLLDIITAHDLLPDAIVFGDGSHFVGPGVIRFSELGTDFICEGNMFVEGTVEWNGRQWINPSFWNGPGILRVMDGFMRNATFESNLLVSAEGANPKIVLDGCTNFATFRWRSKSALSSGSYFQNAGLFILETNCVLEGLLPGCVENIGTIITAPGSGTVSLTIGSVFTNRSAINAVSNTVLELIPTYDLPEAIAFADGTHFGGPGLVRLLGGTPIVCDGNLEIDGELEFGPDQVWGSPVWSGPGMLRWIGGTMNTATFASGLQMEIEANDGIMRGRCTNLTTMHWREPGSVSIESGARFNNQGLFEVETDASMNALGGSGAFINSPGGTFRQITGEFTVPTMTNSGTLELDKGTLNVTTTFAQTTGGNYRVALGGNTPCIDFNQILANTCVIDGTLTVMLTNGFVPAVGSSFLMASNNVQLGRFGLTVFPETSSNSLWRLRYPSGGLVVQLVEPLSMSEPSFLPDGSFRFSLTGAPGAAWNIESSTNLIHWMTIATNNLFTGTFTFTDTNAPSFGRRFYRANIPE